MFLGEYFISKTDAHADAHADTDADAHADAHADALWRVNFITKNFWNAGIG